MGEYSIRQYCALIPGKDSAQAPWCPPADIYSKLSNWIIKLELAGVYAEDVEVTSRERTLIISGKRRDWPIEDGFCHHCLEIPYSSFEKIIHLPCVIDSERIETRFQEGMLLIHLQAKETSS